MSKSEGRDRSVAAPEPNRARAAPSITFRAWLGLSSAVVTWAWAVVVLALLILIRWVGDRWWGVAVLVFLPRWMFLAPLPLLALASGVAGRLRDWIVQGAVTLVVAGPLMAVSLPIHQLWDRRADGLRVRVLTLNRSMARLDRERLMRLIEEERIDLICFQEGINKKNPELEADLDARGWHRDRERYVASRYPIVAELPQLPKRILDVDRFQAVLIRVKIRAAPGLEFWLATVHMPTLRFGFYRFLESDTEGLGAHVAWWDRELGRVLDGLAEVRDAPLLMGGDFNVPPDYAAMAALSSSFRFAFEDAGWGYGYTRPARRPWLRIDHILASPDWIFTRCWVGPDVGSDHLPLIAEAVLPGRADSATAASGGSAAGR
jgi:endonuclease/exonuclease/phosphatase (EEP) superfamily protein YafD